MEPTIPVSRAERAGGALGRLWKKWLRLDDKICSRLATFGLPKGFTKFVLWAIKLSAIGALFYAAFWAAVLLLLGVVALGIVRYSGTGLIDVKQPEYEYRDGHSGIGLYDEFDLRVDPDPYEP